MTTDWVRILAEQYERDTYAVLNHSLDFELTETGREWAARRLADLENLKKLSSRVRRDREREWFRFNIEWDYLEEFYQFHGQGD